MLIQENIIETKEKAKLFASILFDRIRLLNKSGEDVSLLKNKLVILTNWIRILESYLVNNFDENGNITTPLIVCLTELEIIELIAKMNVTVGNIILPITNNLMDDFWNDKNYWDDSQTWNDKKPIL